MEMIMRNAAYYDDTVRDGESVRDFLLGNSQRS
jgi:hypothetical protein